MSAYVCPKCNSTNMRIERRINGKVECTNCGHILVAGGPTRFGLMLMICLMLVGCKTQSVIFDDLVVESIGAIMSDGKVKAGECVYRGRLINQFSDRIDAMYYDKPGVYKIGDTIKIVRAK